MPYMTPQNYHEARLKGATEVLVPLFQENVFIRLYYAVLYRSFQYSCDYYFNGIKMHPGRVNSLGARGGLRMSYVDVEVVKKSAGVYSFNCTGETPYTAEWPIFARYVMESHPRLHPVFINSNSLTLTFFRGKCNVVDDLS